MPALDEIRNACDPAGILLNANGKGKVFAP